MPGSDAARSALRAEPAGGYADPEDEVLWNGATSHGGELQSRRRGAPGERITVLIAASGSRQDLQAAQITAAIEEGIRTAMPSARVLKLPDGEGNLGFVEEVVHLSGGAMARVGLLGPRGEGSAGRLGLLGPPSNLTGVIAIDEAVELQSLSPDDRDLTRASSRQAGQLILAALEHGVRRIIIGCGNTGANDGGIGMASVLGVRFLDKARTEIAEAGGLLRLASIDMSRRDRRLDGVSIEAVVSPQNDLLGARGVLRVHGSRLGASPAQVLRLEQGLTRYAEVVRESLGVDVARLAGAGASGGLGAGLVAFTGAHLRSRLDFLQSFPALQELLGAADLVITVDEDLHGPESLQHPQDPRQGEAQTGARSWHLDRLPSWVTRQARAIGLPVIALGTDSIGDAEAAADGDSISLPAVRAALLSGEQAARHARARLRDASAAALEGVLSAWNRSPERA